MSGFPPQVEAALRILAVVETRRIESIRSGGPRRAPAVARAHGEGYAPSTAQVGEAAQKGGR